MKLQWLVPGVAALTLILAGWMFAGEDAYGAIPQPGQFCATLDHGVTRPAPDGKALTCTYKDGWRWEPAGRSPVAATAPVTAWVGVTKATVCAGVLGVSYDTQQLVGGTWSGVQDKGGYDVQLLAANGRYGVHGTWLRPAKTAGFEHYRRVKVDPALTFSLVRIVGRGQISAPAVVEPCP